MTARSPTPVADHVLRAIRALKCRRKSADFGVSDGISDRSSSALGKAQIQLDGAQIQLDYAGRDTDPKIENSHKVHYAKIDRPRGANRLP